MDLWEGAGRSRRRENYNGFILYEKISCSIKVKRDKTKSKNKYEFKKNTLITCLPKHYIV